MSPNLASAKQAIQAELSHARQGMDFYTARVQALETALTQLESVDDDETASHGRSKRKTAMGSKQKAGQSKRGRKPRSLARGNAAGGVSSVDSSDTSQGKKRDRKARKSNRSNDAEQLPSTGADFWLNLVTDEPQSAVDIASAAIKTMGLKPDQKGKIQKLKQRVAPALTSLVTAQKIHDSGAGRERRYYKGEQHAV